MAAGYDVTEDYLPFPAAESASEDDDHTVSWFYDPAADVIVPNGDHFRSGAGSSFTFDHTDRGLSEMFLLNESLPLCPGALGFLFGSNSAAVTADPTVCNSTWARTDDDGHEEMSGNYWVLILIVFPVLTVFGNVLVVMSVYRERSLQSVTNYFIVSLAIADIMVAILVMPLAVYVEVNNGIWELGDALCDTWVALDVMCCTASILNLAAIGVDRFYAVTQPIKYSKHKNSKRVHVMLALTWVISIAISSPIALGMNYTERREKTPTLCTFYNSDFLIFSSMGSFYIPCIVMTLLYWRIFHAIRQRARKSKASAAPTTHAVGSGGANNQQHEQQQQRKLSARGSSGASCAGGTGCVAEPEVVIVNRPPSTANTTALANSTKLSHIPAPPPPPAQFNIAITSETEDNCSTPVRCLLPVDPGRKQQTVFNHVPADCQVTTVDECTDVDGGGITPEVNSSSEMPPLSPAQNLSSVNRKRFSTGPENGGIGHVYCAPTTVVIENYCTGDDEVYDGDVGTQALTNHHDAKATTSLAPTLPAAQTTTSFGGCRKSLTTDGDQPEVQRNGGNSDRAKLRDSVSVGGSCGGTKLTKATADRDRRTFVTRFNFGLKSGGKKSAASGAAHPQKRVSTGAQNAQRRERKATKTLAIVLGVFLLCWVPFFTINIINAICIRYDLFDNNQICQIDPILFSFFVWLGYMNSFLNPVIYTIFNMEFRRAFKKILQNPCGK